MKKLKLPQPKRKDADRTPQHHFSAAKLAYMAFLCVTMSLVFCQPAFAATDVWSKAKEIMQDVYTQIVAISTIAAIVTASVALLLMNFSRSDRTVDESRAWLKRICITWAILNGLGFKYPPKHPYQSKLSDRCPCPEPAECIRCRSNPSNHYGKRCPRSQ